MRSIPLLVANVVACVFTATVAYGLIVPFGRHELSDAGAGCVAGYTSDHGTIAYFQGDTAMLNAYLASLAGRDRHSGKVRVVLHAGAHTIEAPEESLADVLTPAPTPISVDWSARKSCPFEKVRTGTCTCDVREVVVEIWVADEIKLDDLRVPEHFQVESAGEIERFVKRRVNGK